MLLQHHLENPAIPLGIAMVVIALTIITAIGIVVLVNDFVLYLKHRDSIQRHRDNGV